MINESVYSKTFQNDVSKEMEQTPTVMDQNQVCHGCFRQKSTTILHFYCN